MADPPKTEELLERAGRGDRSATRTLLGRHRGRLRRMVACRMDPRLRSRVDPSDVIQEALVDAAKGLSGYLAAPPLPFYPWLRQFAWNRLVDLHRRHVLARRRSVKKEIPLVMRLPAESASHLAARLESPRTGPVTRVVRDEMVARVRAGLELLSAAEREVVVLRQLEGLSVREVAAVLEITEAAVKNRHLRAIRRLRELLPTESSGDRR